MMIYDLSSKAALYDKLKKLSVCLLLIAGFTACSLNIPYENQYSDPDAISTAAKARELLATAYAQLPDASFELSVLSDDFEPNAILPKDVSLNNLYKWQTLPIEQLALTLWQGYYGSVAIANAVLERASLLKTEGNPKELQSLQAVMAEAKAMKAYCFFNLLRLFAPDYADGSTNEGIPLKSKLEMESLPRADVKTCTDTIRSLLTEALETNYTVSDEYWFSPNSLYYLMAELELYAHNYEQAAHYAGKVIAAQGGYETMEEKSYRALWTDAACSERIFSWFTENYYYTGINMTKEAGDYLTVNTSLLSLYEANDVRRNATVFPFKLDDNTLTDEEATVQCFGKYNKENKEKRNFHTVNRYRVSGACFILAEALTRGGKDTGIQEAIKTMNRYLSARKAALLPEEGLTGEKLLAIILQEKWKEFVGEGERYFDLKRLRKTILSEWNTTGVVAVKSAKPDDYRWNFPIPRGEYLYNDRMTQNDGWPK